MVNLINNDMESLTRKIIEYVNDNIGWIFSKVAVNGERNKQQISVSSDFPDAWTIDGQVITAPADSTDLRQTLDLPAVILSMYDGSSTRAGSGDVIGHSPDGRVIRALKNRYIVQFDVWARTPQQRDFIGGRLVNIVFKQRHTVARNLGIEEINLRSFGERGFDLTDRILQYQSHQITKVWRRLLEFDIISENYFMDEVEEDYFVLEGIDIQTNFNSYTFDLIAGDLIEEYLKVPFQNINVGLLK